MLKLTIEGNSPADLKANLLAAAQDFGGATSNTTTADTPKKAATAGKPAAAAKAETPKALDFKTEVAAPFLALADKNRDKAVEVLSQFGVAKASGLKPEQYVEFVAAVKAADEALENDLG